MDTIKYELYHKSKKEISLNIFSVIGKIDGIELQEDDLKYNYEGITHSYKLTHQPFLKNEKSAVLIIEKEYEEHNDLKVIEELKETIRIELSKKGIQTTLTYDGVSIFYFRELVDLLHIYEWKLRKILYLIINDNINDNWVEELVLDTTIGKIKERLKGRYNNAKNDFLQHLNLSEYESFLFDTNYIDVITNDDTVELRYTELDNKQLIKILSADNTKVSKPYSLWERYFEKYLEDDVKLLQEDMSQIRDGRNSVNHYKELSFKEYNKLKEKLEEYISKFDEIINKINEGILNVRDRNAITEDFERFTKNLFASVSDMIQKNLIEPLENVSNIMTVPEILQKKLYEPLANLDKMMSAVETMQRNLYANTPLTGITKIKDLAEIAHNQIVVTVPYFDQYMGLSDDMHQDLIDEMLKPSYLKPEHIITPLKIKLAEMSLYLMGEKVSEFSRKDLVIPQKLYSNWVDRLNQKDLEDTQ